MTIYYFITLYSYMIYVLDIKIKINAWVIKAIIELWQRFFSSTLKSKFYDYNNPESNFYLFILILLIRIIKIKF